VISESLLAKLDIDEQTSLICAQVGIITRKSMSPAEAVADAQRLVAWVNEGKESHKRFRLSAVALAMDHRVGGASIDKIMEVASQLYKAMYPPPPPPTPVKKKPAQRKKKAVMKKGSYYKSVG
jgi:hypothetical protein